MRDDRCFRIARDRAGTHEHTRNVAKLRGTEYLTNLSDTRLHLFELGFEHTLQRLFDIVNPLLNARVDPTLPPFTGGTLASLNVGAHVESDNNGVVDGGEVDVALRDGPHTTVEDTQ